MERIDDAEQAKIEETDETLIENRYREIPSEQVQLLAMHLSRPDGFVKALLFGSLKPSKELHTAMPGFVLSHRGYYMQGSRGTGNQTKYFDTNETISFSIGTCDPMYGDATRKRVGNEDLEGLGFAFKAEEIINDPRTEIVYGDIGLDEIIEQGKDVPGYEERFAKFFNIPEDKVFDYDLKPDKKDFLDFVQLGRKMGKIRPIDHLEAGLTKSGKKYPKKPLTNAIIFIPVSRRPAITRLIDIKVNKLQETREKLHKVFRVDINRITGETLLERYNNIYWYPQRNINLAMKYLSTHPEMIDHIIPSDEH